MKIIASKIKDTNKIILSQSEWKQIGEKAGWISKTANIDVCPLDGKSKKSAKTAVYKLTKPLTDGFFNDDNWSHVNAIWQTLRQNNINILVNSADYKHEEGNPIAKEWHFEIPFIDKTEKQQSLRGYLKAFFCGTISDPTSRYDMALVLF